MTHCGCDTCSGIAEPPTAPGPCGALNPDVPGEFCGEYENHDGEHGNWARSVVPSVRGGDPLGIEGELGYPDERSDQ